MGVEGLSVYGATKTTVRSLAGSFITKGKNRKIRVNVVSPERDLIRLLVMRQFMGCKWVRSRSKLLELWTQSR